MSSTPGVHEHGYDSTEHQRAPAHRISTIPDLRFESSYLRSVRRYAVILRTTTTGDDLLKQDDIFEKTDGQGIDAHDGTQDVASVRRPFEIIMVDWTKVFWATVRDQIISPFLQGALWAFVSFYISPFSSQLGSRMGTFVHESIPTKEGSGVTWLRNWAKTIGFSTSTSRQTAKT